MKNLQTAFFVAVIAAFFSISNASAQNILDNGRLNGAFQIDAQSYKPDSTIGAPEVDEEVMSNAYLNLIYSSDGFEAGIRYEGYFNPMLGFDPRYEGHGIAHRYATYRSDFVEVTAGNFYEQFGSGLILRSYWEPQLGIDNAFDGLRFKVKPTEWLEAKGLIGKNRSFWGTTDGIIRGGDVSVNLNGALPGVLPDNALVSVGGGVVSRFQADEESFYKLPENVLAYSARASLITGSIMVDGEYAYKYNDPNATNHISYNPGTAVSVNANYFAKGIGFALNAHRYDNFDFRSDRDAVSNVATLNYLPPLTKQHTYSLAAMFPYATQLNGEVGAQAELTYTIPRKTKLGGKYGTTITANVSRVHALDTTHIDEFEYESDFFAVSDRLFFQDLNLAISRKWNKDFKTVFTFLNMIYDRDVAENEGLPHYGRVTSTVAIADLLYKFDNTNSLRLELQHMWATQDSTTVEPDNKNGDWLTILAEYSIAPTWFFTVYDEYNYGNDDEDLQVHYLNAAIGYVHESTRIAVGFGRRRGGVICVGGVCRTVPASNGFNLSISTTF